VNSVVRRKKEAEPRAVASAGTHVHAVARTYPGGIREGLLAYGYLAPAFAILALFTFGPFAYVFFASLTHAPGAATQKFVGLGNYRYLLDPAQQSGFLGALGRTLYFTVGVVPTSIALSLLCALLLRDKVRGWSVFRLLFFIPFVTPALRQAGAHVVVDSDAHDAEGLLRTEKVAAVVCGAGASLLFLTRVREQYAPRIIQKVLRRPALV